MLRKRFIFLIFPLISGLVFFLPQGKAEAGFPCRVVEDFGVEVLIVKKPQRIISLAPANTEILFAVGAGDKIVAVTDYCDFPSQAVNIDKIGGYSTPNIEKIVEKNPDLIVAAYGNGEENIKRLRELGFAVIALNPGSLEDILNDIKLVGKTCGREKEAGSLAARLKERINAVKHEAAVLSSEGKPKVLWIMWYPELWTAGRGTFFDELVRIAGGKNIASEFRGWKIISRETILAENPQIIFCSKMGKEKSILPFILKDPHFARVDAVKNGFVFEIDQDTLERPGPRIVDGLESIASFIKSWHVRRER